MGGGNLLRHLHGRSLRPTTRVGALCGGLHCFGQRVPTLQRGSKSSQCTSTANFRAGFNQPAVTGGVLDPGRERLDGLVLLLHHASSDARLLHVLKDEG